MTTPTNTPEFNQQVLSKLCDMVTWLDRWESGRTNDPTLISDAMNILKDSRILLVNNNIDYKKY